MHGAVSWGGEKKRNDIEFLCPEGVTIAGRATYNIYIYIIDCRYCEMNFLFLLFARKVQ